MWGIEEGKKKRIRPLALELPVHREKEGGRQQKLDSQSTEHSSQ